MKRFYLLTALIVLVCCSQAQIRLSLLGGPQSAKVLESNSQPGWDSTTKPFYSNRAGIHIGFLADIPIGVSGKWSLQPAILYSAKGRKYFRLFDTATAEQSDTLSYGHNFFTNYIDLPFNLAYKIPLGKRTRFVLSAGPYFSFFFNGKNSFEWRRYSDNAYSKDESDIQVGKAAEKVHTFDFGWNARAGFDFGGVYLTGFFSQGLSSFYEASYAGKFKHQVAGASIGFWLNKVTPAAVPLKDRDKDGIPDKDDACPLIAGTAATQGCPDKDGDGVADQTDKCPDIPGVARYNGCPIPDSDKDGVNDEEDKCPQVPGLAKYLGCPIPDSDGDGINDEEDSCKQVAGLARYHGCPIPDRDNDGVNDEEDKCPDQPGSRENNGCPEIKQEIVEKVNYAARNIFFSRNSNQLDSRSFESLNDVANIMNEHPELTLQIDGHTDNTGNAAYNLILSQKRADAVLEYLASKGVERNRMEAKGYGQEKPITGNDSPAQRAQNRRVELKLSYK